jgi:tripartite ATP-independent transporter DctM subunit
VGTLVAIGLMVFMMVLKFPVEIAIGFATMIGLIVAGYSLDVIPRMMIEAVDSYILLAVPFFILAGHLLNAGGATDRIFAFARSLFAPLRGGLAQVNVASSAIFAGMSGAAMADLAGLGTVHLRVMTAAGYTAPFTIALTLAGCTMAVIIPPSISLIVYSLVTGVSVGRLFLAGIVPGLLMAASLMLWIYLRAVIYREPFLAKEPFEPAAVWTTFMRGLPALALPPAMLLALASGFATATEVGAFAAAYAFVFGIATRELTLPKLWDVLVETASTTALTMYVFAVSAALSWLLTVERSVHNAAALISDNVSGPLAGLLVINIFLLFLGMFLETLPALIIAAAVFFPIVQTLGVDPVHFGIIIALNLIIGIITPPMGIGVFIAAKVAKLPVEVVLWAVLPYMVPLLLSLLAITAFPGITLWLPDLVFGPQR